MYRFMKKKTLILLYLALICAVAYSQPVPIIFDTDMGSDCDDVGALALLNTYADQNKANILCCIYSSGKVPYGAGVIHAINTYYGRPDTPVGADHDTIFGDPVDKMTAEKLAKDTAEFHNTIIHNKDAGEQTQVTRKILSQQKDNSVVYITVGHTKALYNLLHSPPDSISKLSGYELASQKIKKWIALGALNADNTKNEYTKDWNFFFNKTANYTKYLVDSFPKPTVFIGCGTNVLSGKSLKNTPPGNIVRTAYRDWLWNVFEQTLDNQRPSWDIIAVYYAVEGVSSYLKTRSNGWLQFDAQKGCRWISNDNKRKHSYIILKDGMQDTFAAYLDKMISTTPKHKPHYLQY